MQEKRKNRAECFWGMHNDFHAHPAYGAIVGATLKEEDIRAICENAKPDFIQIDCKGHTGYASYPSKIGNSMPMALDTLEVWRRITKEYGIRLYMHISGLFDEKYCEEHPEDTAIISAKTPSSLVRLDGKYLDEYFIPQVSELVEKYDIDGIWVDGECWAVEIECHPEAIKLFEETTGISLNGTIPTKKGEPYFEELLEFTRDRYRKFLNHYVDALHAKYPHLEICSSWAFSDYMPEPICANVDFLSGDLDNIKGVYSARYAGRMLALHGKPWDLMSWGFRYMIYGTLLTPPKHPSQLMQEAAAVISLGGTYQNYLLQFSDGSPDINRIMMDVPLGEFMRARRPYCHRGKIIEQAALLVPSRDRYKEMSRPFTGEGREKYYGLTALLCDSGESLSIVNEYVLKENISKYPLVILSELYADLESDVIETLRSYVLQGGSLMITGAKTAKQFADAGFPYATAEYTLYPYIPGWSERTTGYRKREFPNGVPAYFSVVEGADYGVTKGAVIVNAENATVLAKLYPSLQEKNGKPVAMVTAYGKGKIGVIGFNIGAQYNDAVQYQQRDLIRNMTAMLYNPIARVESVDGICEIVCLSVRGKLMLQIVNAGGGHRDPLLSTENYIPPLENVVISMRGDIDIDKVVLRPEDEIVELSKRSGRTYFKIPKVAIHTVAEICTKNSDKFQ
jgi:hypothetical protein